MTQLVEAAVDIEWRFLRSRNGVRRANSGNKRVPRMLAAVWAFRVVSESDLHDGREDRRKGLVTLNEKV